MKPEFVPWLWIIYVAYVLYKRHRENNHLEKSILILASISLIIVSGGFSLLTYYNLSPELQLMLNILIIIVLFIGIEIDGIVLSNFPVDIISF